MRDDRNDLRTCRVKRGELKNDDAVAVAMALDDLRVYWEKAFGAPDRSRFDPDPESSSLASHRSQ